MGLSNSQKPTGNFEDMDDGANTASDDTAQTAAQAAPAQESASRAVATPAPARIQAVEIMKQSSISQLENAFEVEWDSVPTIVTGQGDMIDKSANGESIGREILFQLMSYQYQWVASPKDDSAEMDTVKYAKNPTHAEDGTSLASHVEALKAQGWANAGIAHRVILVGEILAVDGKTDAKQVGTLYQINMPDTGRRSFEAYKIQAAYKVSKGFLSIENSTKLKITTQSEQVRGSTKKYTKFNVALAS